MILLLYNKNLNEYNSYWSTVFYEELAPPNVHRGAY